MRVYKYTCMMYIFIRKYIIIVCQHVTSVLCNINSCLSKELN